VVSPVRFRLSP